MLSAEGNSGAGVGRRRRVWARVYNLMAVFWIFLCYTFWLDFSTVVRFSSTQKFDKLKKKWQKTCLQKNSQIYKIFKNVKKRYELLVGKLLFTNDDYISLISDLVELIGMPNDDLLERTKDPECFFSRREMVDTWDHPPLPPNWVRKWKIECFKLLNT